MATADENIVPENAMTIVEKRIRYQILMALMRTLADDGELSLGTIDRARELAGTICDFDRSSIFIN